MDTLSILLLITGMSCIIGSLCGVCVFVFVQKRATEQTAVHAAPEKHTPVSLTSDSSGDTNSYEHVLDVDIAQYTQKKMLEAQIEAEKIAQELVALAIQRCSSKTTHEITTSTVYVEDDAIKGRLIGKGGRNIEWIERTMGVELIIDETPHLITISGFSSIRKYIAKRTIEMLITDGRIHPSSIEEMYQKVSRTIHEEITQIGNETVAELGITDFDSDIVHLIGRLSLRTSYGQNMLTHSVEMAHLARLLAQSLKVEFPHVSHLIDEMVCVKGALLHDIGKAVDEDMTPKGNHIEIGEHICDAYNLGWKIKKCISSHHTTGGDKASYFDEVQGQVCLEAIVVDACDSISGSRLGARKEEVQSYQQRVTIAQDIAQSYDGVLRTWIMRGAKEMWVFFDADTISPEKAQTITQEIAHSLTRAATLPTSIKVIGIREDRIVSYTK